MAQFSSQDASNVAMLIKRMAPNINDQQLASLVHDASQVQNDPAKTAALGDRIKLIATGRGLADGGEVTDDTTDTTDTTPASINDPYAGYTTGSDQNLGATPVAANAAPVAPQDVSTTVPNAYTVPPVGNPDLSNPGGVAGSQILQGGVNAVLAAQQLAANQPTQADQAAAEQAYQQSIANNAPGRAVANFMAATGGPAVAVNSTNAWDALNKQNKDLTLGAVTRAQDFTKGAIANYQAGVTMAGNVLDDMDKSGKFQIDANAAALAQKKLQLDLVGQAANTQVTQQLMDPTSQLSLSARMSAKQTLQIAGYTPAQIQAMVPDTMTGIQAAPIAAAGGTTLANIKTKAESNQANALAAQASAAAQKSKIEAAGLVQGQTAMQNWGAPAANYAAVGASGPAAAQASAAASNVGSPTNAAAQTTIARQGGTPTGPTTAQVSPGTGTGGTGTIGGYQMSPTYSPESGLSLQTSTVSQQAGRETAAALADQTAGINQYKLGGGKTSAQTALVQAPSMGGLIGAGGRNIFNYSNSNATKDYQLTLDRLNQEAENLGLITDPGGGNGTGAAVSATGAQLAKTNPVLGTAMAAGGHLFNGGQPVGATTNPRTVQELAVAVQEARAKQEAMIPYLNAYQQSHGGSIAGAVVPDHISNSQTMVNPKTGDVQVVYTPQDGKALKSQGWQRKEDFLGSK